MPIDLLILNGSPKRDGESMSLAMRLARSSGLPFEVDHLYRMAIKPCDACLACAKSKKCVADSEDDMGGIRDRIHAARGLVVVSPLHFTSLTAPLIALFSRLEPEWLACSAFSRPPGNRSGAGVLVVTGGADYPNMFEPARRVAAAALNTLGRVSLGMVEARETGRIPVMENRAALEQAEKTGLAMRLALEAKRS